MALSLLAASAILSPTAMAKQTPCYQQVIDDWFDDGRVNKIYPLPCYPKAIKSLPPDLLIYGNAEDEIGRAWAYAKQGKPDPGGEGPTPVQTDTTGDGHYQDGHDEDGHHQDGHEPGDRNRHHRDGHDRDGHVRPLVCSDAVARARRTGRSPARRRLRRLSPPPDERRRGRRRLGNTAARHLAPPVNWVDRLGRHFPANCMKMAQNGCRPMHLLASRIPPSVAPRGTEDTFPSIDGRPGGRHGNHEGNTRSRDGSNAPHDG